MLEASDDGVAYASSPSCPRSSCRRRRPCRSAPSPSRRSRRAASGSCSPGISAADALPRLAPGRQLPPVLRRVSEFLVSEFALCARRPRPPRRAEGGLRRRARLLRPRHRPGRRHDGDRPGAGRRRDRTRRRAGRAALGRTGRVAGWSCGSGPRSPARPTGRPRRRRPGSRSTSSTRAKVRRYLDTYLGAVRRREPGARLDALLSDSIESGPQNFTDELRERFAELRGYDPLPWLPALAGYVVGDVARTDRFLWDYRRTLADLLARRVLRHARRRWRTRGASPTTPRRSRTTARSSATTWRCAATRTCRWARCGCSTPAAGPAPTYVADLKGASSVAHVYGKPFTGAESMSAFHRPWSYTPRRLKHVADLELALGVTRFCIHTSPHQPTAGAAARDRAVALPRPDVHPHRAVGGAGRTVDRLPGPLLVAAQPGRAGGRRRGVRRRGGAAHRAVRGRAGPRCAGRLRLRLRQPRRARAPVHRGRRRPGRRARRGTGCSISAARALG